MGQAFCEGGVENQGSLGNINNISHWGEEVNVIKTVENLHRISKCPIDFSTSTFQDNFFNDLLKETIELLDRLSACVRKIYIFLFWCHFIYLRKKKI